ncbi:MAG TPA: inositol monophosphatase family protein [Gemmataceae bacterium]|nr:inositol monophosphatase family protein [Gemmataceae bacterium]
MKGRDLIVCLEAAQEAARRGAAVLQEWRNRFSVREKARFDLVTEADLASQKAIQEYLQYHFPDHAFLGEEQSVGWVESSEPTADRTIKSMVGSEDSTHPTIKSSQMPTWIVDPLDGTTNYVHDCPMYCVSIGLMVQGELVVGVVFDPVRQEMFHAAAGQGAWLETRGEGTANRVALAPGATARRLQTSRSDRLEESLLATGFPPDLRGQERALDWWRYFSLRTRSLRRTGSTALNMAYVAAGRFDAYWGFDNHAWDVAGAAVLIREAGGEITTTDGQPFDPFRPDTLASNGPLHPIMLEAFRQPK